MSIRASGIAESGAQRNGKPVLKELTSAESVDVVTRAGAGGLILTEAARPNSQEVDMTEQQITALVESAVTKAVAAVQSPVKALEARALKGDAVLEANRILSSMSLHEAFKNEVVQNVCRDIPVKEGQLDTEKFTELVNAEAKRMGALAAQFSGGGRVIGMGASAPPEADPAKVAEARKRAEEETKSLLEAEEDAFARLTGIRAKEKAA